MAGFEESDLYAAFGLEQPAAPDGGTPGERDPEPAAPGAQEGQEQGTEPGMGGAQEPEQDHGGQEPPEDHGEAGDPGGSGSAGGSETPPDGGEKAAQPPQTAAQRAEHAARRRREEQQAAIDAAVKKALEEERARSKGEMEAFFTKAGLKNTITGKPITSVEEFNAWRADYEAAKLQKDLKAGKLTSEALRSAVEQTPAIRELKKLQERQAAEEQQRQQAAAKARIDAELVEIHKLDPSINVVEDLLAMPNSKAFYDLVKKGNSFLDAFRLANFDRLTAARAEAAKQQAIRNTHGKDHLTGTGVSQGTGALAVPADEMKMFKIFNPEATDAEITAWYNKQKK